MLEAQVEIIPRAVKQPGQLVEGASLYMVSSRFRNGDYLGTIVMTHSSRYLVSPHLCCTEVVELGNLARSSCTDKDPSRVIEELLGPGGQYYSDGLRAKVKCTDAGDCEMIVEHEPDVVVPRTGTVVLMYLPEIVIESAAVNGMPLNTGLVIQLALDNGDVEVVGLEAINQARTVGRYKVLGLDNGGAIVVADAREFNGIIKTPSYERVMDVFTSLLGAIGDHVLAGVLVTEVPRLSGGIDDLARGLSFL